MNVANEYLWRPSVRTQHAGISRHLFEFQAVARPGTATVNGVTYGVDITGATAVAGSTVGTTGNQITATAVGNSAVSSLLAR